MVIFRHSNFYGQWTNLKHGPYHNECILVHIFRGYLVLQSILKSVVVCLNI